MKKKARELKKGDKIKLGGKTFVVKNTELSEIGKQGVRKVRIATESESGQGLVIIRPEDYPFETG
jgi:translation elongation factor P/translation initiation factor 5A